MRHESPRSLAVQFVIRALGVTFICATLLNTATADWWKRVVQGQMKSASRPTEQADAARLPDDGERRRQLERIRRQTADGQHVDAALALGKAAATAENDFLIPANKGSGTGRSYLAELDRLIMSLPPEARAAYELQFGADARQAFAKASAQRDAEAATAVVRRWPHTAAAREALAWLALDHRLRGRHAEAAVTLRHLLASLPPAVEQSELKLDLALALARSGQQDAALRLLESLPTASSQPWPWDEAGKASPMPEGERRRAWLAQVSDAPFRANRELDWLNTGGDAARARTSPVELPLMSAAWMRESIRHISAARELESEAVGRATHQARLFTRLEPLVVGDLVLLRTPDGFDAIDRRSGQLRWRHPTDFDSPATFDIWNDGACGPLASDGRSVFLVRNRIVTIASGEDAQQQVVQLGRGQVWVQMGAVAGNTSSGAPVALGSQLVALDIADGCQGKLRWEIGGADGGAEPKLAGAYFLGAPVAYGGQVYALAELQHAVRLLTLDARKGKLHWAQDVALVEQSILENPLRQQIGASPSIGGGVAICPTGCGTVVAVDLVLRRLAWSQALAQNSANQPNNSTGTSNPLSDGWFDNTAIIAGDRVLVTPPGANELYCLNLVDGAVLWKAPRGDYELIGGVSGGNVVLVSSRRVNALRLADGKNAWQRDVPMPDRLRVVGRGLMGDDRFWIPVEGGGLLELDLHGGSIVRDLRSPRELELGHLVWAHGTIISHGRELTQAFLPRAAVEQRVTELLQANPDDAASLAARGDLRLSDRDLPAALADYRAAYRARPTPALRQRLIAGLLESASRAAPADADRINAELDAILAP